MPENEEAVAVFSRCGDQWLLAPNGKRLGLLVPSVESTIRMMDVSDPLTCFDQVQIIADKIRELEEEENA